MKKFSFATLLLAAVLALTACSSAAGFRAANPDDYVTPGEYKGLAYKEEDTSVSDYDLTVAINNLLADKGYRTEYYDTIKEGKLEIGDTANIDFKGMKDGVAFKGGTDEGYELTIGSGSFIEGFEEGLVGVEVGETVNLNLTFPKDYGNAELAGQAVVFEVKVNFISKQVKYKDLTDTIAKEIDKSVKTAKELIDKTKESLEQTNKSNAEATMKNTLWNEVIEHSTFKKSIPESMTEALMEDYLAYYKSMASQYGYDDIDALLEASNVSRTDFDKSAKEYCQSQAKSQMLAYAIAKAEGYTVSDKEFDTKAEEYAKASGYSDKLASYIKTVGEETIYDQIVLDYAVDLVAENAKITPAK